MGFCEKSAVRHFATKCTVVTICRALNVKPLLRIERSQIRRFGHVSKIPWKTLARQVLLATPTGKRPRGWPRTKRSYYTSDLAWYRLGVERAELSEIAVDLEVFQVLLGMLYPRHTREEKRAWKLMKECLAKN